MDRERMQRNDQTGQGSAGSERGDPLPTRNYRQDAARSDDDLSASLNQLGQMFQPCDVVNRGAQ